MIRENRILLNKNIYILIGLSILFFLVKGIKYLIIGSYLPLIFIFLVVGLIFMSVYFDERKHFVVLKIWSLFLLLWSTIRIVLWLVLIFDKNLTEAHLRDQFGLGQQLVSILMMLIGFRILKNLRSLKKQNLIISDK